MEETRFGRLEDRVDSLKDDVAEIKVKQTLTHETLCGLKNDFEEHVEEIRNHITGDNKIINHIEPIIGLLPTLSEIAQQYHFEKLKKEEEGRLRKENREKIKDVSVKVGLLGSLISAVLYVLHKFGL